LQARIKKFDRMAGGGWMGEGGRMWEREEKKEIKKRWQRSTLNKRGGEEKERGRE
jgi:hypothetical protein